jgi:RHS repeat-associated protein
LPPPPLPPPPGIGNGGGGNNPPPCPCQPKTNNPVDLASGNAEGFHPLPFGGTSVLATVDLNFQYRSQDNRIGLFGRGTSFSYGWFAQQVGDAVRVTSPDGVQFMLSRGADGVFRATSGHQGAIQMEVTPSASGRTLKLATGTQYEFDNPGRVLAVVDVRGNRTTFALNAQGVPLSLTDAAGQVYQFQLASTNPPLISRITDPAGRFVEFGYDASRRLASYRDQGGNITLIEYDVGNRIRKITDPRGAIKEIEYDSVGRAVREVLPEGGEERYSYNAVGNTISEARHTDPNGNVTVHRFNGLGYATRRVDALGRTQRYDLDPVNNLMRRSVDPAGRVTQYTYNQRGDRIRTIDAGNNQELIEYDLRFQKPVRIENALGHVTTKEYNAQGNIIRFTNAENETTTFTYTARGQLETVTDPLGRVRRLAYDSNGNLTDITDKANGTATRKYDIANRLIEGTDALNRTSRITYDNLDRVTEIRDAMNGLTRSAYDANGNLLSVTDPNNNAVERNVYDLRNRLVRRTDARDRDTIYIYDHAGNLTRMTDRRGQVTEYAYDALNRVTQVRDHDGRTTTYAYDLAGNLSRLSDTQSGDILMSYDALDRLVEVVTPQGTVTYTYDAIGRRLSRAMSGGDVTTYTYDKADRLKTVTLQGRTVSYSYDLGGRLRDKVLPNGITVRHDYDALDRLTSLRYEKSDASVLEAVTYAYDAAGQRTQQTVATASLQETPFSATYDSANRLISINLAGENLSLSYDDNGNLVSKTGATSGTTTYVWDARNQLVAISGPAGNATFRYDALGRRIEKTVNGMATGFFYDGAQAIAELKSNSVDNLYHTGFAIDEVLARYGSAGNRTLLVDALMSVIAQVDDSQSVENFYAYSPHGEAAVLGPDGGNALRYTGRENDGTGLYYYRARYYDPLLKRFISEDSLGVAAGTNLYSYVDGNPTGNTDPYGHQATPFPLPGGQPDPKTLMCAMDRAKGINNPACQPGPPPQCCDDPALSLCLSQQATSGMDCYLCARSRGLNVMACVSCAQTIVQTGDCFLQHCGPTKCPKNCPPQGKCTGSCPK